MEHLRKPLAKIEGWKRMPASGLTIAWRGTPNLDDWAAYIQKRGKSRKVILLDRVPERKIKALLARTPAMSRRQIEKLAKG